MSETSLQKDIRNAFESTVQSLSYAPPEMWLIHIASLRDQVITLVEYNCHPRTNE